MDDGDRDVLARDPWLPGLRVALDDDALSELVIDRWPGPGRPPTGARVTYLRYKPTTSVTATVALTHANGDVELAALAATDVAARPKLDKVRDRARPSEQGWATVDAPELDLALVPCTGDRHLPAARDLARSVRRLDRSLAGLDARVLAYKPHRRLVARLERDGRPVALAKAHRPETAREILAATSWQASHDGGGRLPTPELLAADAESGLIVTSWRTGTVVPSSGPVDAAVLDGIGRLVAALHRRPPGWLPSTPVPVDPAPAIARLLPEGAPLARRAWRLATADLVASRPVPVHGDLSRDQIVHGPSGVALLDLDRLHAGDAVDDLASWVAAEAVTELADGASGADTPLPAPPAELLDAYLAAGGPADPARLPGAIARALLDRALEPFRLRMPDWRQRSLHLLQRAADVVVDGIAA